MNNVEVEEREKKAKIGLQLQLLARTKFSTVYSFRASLSLVQLKKDSSKSYTLRLYNVCGATLLFPISLNVFENFANN